MNTPIFVISGPSGSGKDSVIAPYKNNPAFSILVTCTTRPIREGEIADRDYHFLSDDEFEKEIQNDHFLEWEPVFNDKYGSRKNDLENLLKLGRPVIAKLDVKGAMNIKKRYPDAATVFIMPPDIKDAEKRLEKRSTESEEAICVRKSRYRLELGYKDKFDFVIINDDLKKAQEEFASIIQRFINI